jgi:hypothetical protein
MIAAFTEIETKTTQDGPASLLVREWQTARAALAEVERAEHPDVVDRFGRVWSWVSGDLYRHDCLAWTLDMVHDRHCGLPPAKLADNPNYTSLCSICTSEWVAS